MRIRELPVSVNGCKQFFYVEHLEKPKDYRIFHQHLNTTKYTEAPVYNVLYNAMD